MECVINTLPTTKQGLSDYMTYCRRELRRMAFRENKLKDQISKCKELLAIFTKGGES